jgi:hypothetical protein
MKVSFHKGFIGLGQYLILPCPYFQIIKNGGINYSYYTFGIQWFNRCIYLMVEKNNFGTIYK